MKAERPQSRRKTETLSVDMDDSVYHRPRKKAATTSTLFRNVIIGLVIFAGGLYALSQRYDLAKLLVIDLDNPSASLAAARSDHQATERSDNSASANPASATAGQSTHQAAPAAAPSSNVALPAQINVAPVYLGKGKDKK